MKVLLTGAAHVVTGHGPVRGPLTAWSQVGLRRDHDVVLQRADGGWTVLWCGDRSDPARPSAERVIDCEGGLLVPGMVDAHTHAVFAGDRSGEFSRRMAGESYAAIAAEGGGILRTVSQTRQATLQALTEAAATRLQRMRARGVAMVEIKTGYGLDAASEVKLLAAIDALRARFSGQIAVIASAMPGHAVPPEHRDDPARYVDRVCEEVLPAMARSGMPCGFMDVFIERGYFDVAAAERMWHVGRGLGWRLKAHVDEFADIGGVHWAVQSGAVSVEHLLATSPASIEALAGSDTVAVCLPLTSLFLREGYAPMRALVDAGALVAVATDCNPGSAHTTNLPLAMQVAVLNGRLSPMEAVRAVTTTAARALACPGGFDGTFTVGTGFCGSLLAIHHPDELFYDLGGPPLAVPLDLD